MPKLMYGSVNLSKINKEKLVTGKTGDKFLPITIWFNEELDQYGNSASIQQSRSKEEREAGEKALYLGNLKMPANSLPNGGAQDTSATQASPTQDTDLPF